MGVRAYTHLLLLQQQQRRVICELGVFRSTNHRTFRTEFRKIALRTFALRISQITGTGVYILWFTSTYIYSMSVVYILSDVIVYIEWYRERFVM